MPVCRCAHLVELEKMVGGEVANCRRMQHDPGAAALERRTGALADRDVATDVSQHETRRETPERAPHHNGSGKLQAGDSAPPPSV
jgi:hypothetical protein